MQSQAVQTSRAADIPEELFEHILWYACSIGGGRSKTGLKKSVAASVALVCRYWARLARAELFCQITLRNLADVTRFSAILAAAPPAHLEPVAGLLLTLVAAPDQRDVPWLHRVFLHVYPQLPRVPSFRIEALPSDGRPWRSLHPALPRALPGSTMPLDRLVLADVRFTNGRMLARLLASLPLLPYASLHRATFDVAPVREDFYKPPFGLQLCWFTTDSHAACLALVPSLLAHLTERGPAPKLRGGRAAKYVLDAGDLEILDELLSLFSGASAFAIHHGLGQKLTKEQDMQFLEFSCFDDIPSGQRARRAAPPLRFYLEPERRLLQSTALEEAAGQIIVRIHTISIDLRADKISPGAEGVCTESLWTRFATAALKLCYLQHVKITQLCDHDAATWELLQRSNFLGANDTTFKPLLDARRLECRYVDAKSLRTVHLQTKTLKHPKLQARAKEKTASFFMRAGRMLYRTGVIRTCRHSS